MNDQELERKFRVFEQQIMQIQEQLQALEKADLDMNMIKLGLDDLKGKEGKEIRAPIGGGIYVNAKLVSEELLVNIGNKKLVKRSISETKEIIDNQRLKLKQAREQLEGELEKINQELTKTLIGSRDEHNSCCGQGDCEHHEEENCGCEHKH
jgi:prefoldin alpha subunit